jgi:hypothetical protein
MNENYTTLRNFSTSYASPTSMSAEERERKLRESAGEYSLLKSEQDLSELKDQTNPLNVARKQRLRDSMLSVQEGILGKMKRMSGMSPFGGR